MRKHAGTTLHFTVTPMQEFTTTNSSKKPVKTTSLLQQPAAIKPLHTSNSTTRIKSLAWDAYKNELEFE